MNAETGARVGKPLEGHTGPLLSVIYSPNGQHILSASIDTTIRIWDARTGAAVGEPLRGHTDWVQSVACSPGGGTSSLDLMIRQFGSGMLRLVLQLASL